MKSSVKKIIICIFDGLRPDSLSPDLTPNLWLFVHGGIWFRECRSVFPSMTRVAGSSFATGSKPSTHGIVDNAFYHPPLSSHFLLDTSNSDHLIKADEIHNGNFIEAEGFGCALAKGGKNYAVVHTGSAGSAYMVSHKANIHGHWTFSVHGREKSLTPEAVDEMIKRFGPLPEMKIPQSNEVDYGTKVFTDYVIPELRPDVGLIWFVEPDTSCHYREIGSSSANDITKRVDNHFGTILETIRQQPDSDQTLVVAMSDHGQITTTREFDLVERLNKAGFSVDYNCDSNSEILATKGVATALRMTRPNIKLLDELVDVLVSMEETGMILSSSNSTENGPLPGTFAFSQVSLEHSRAPELVWVARSNGNKDYHGLPGTGMISGDGVIPLGGGMHGGLNRHELNSLLAFGGADLPSLGAINDPADITDITPTILTLLGSPLPQSMTGIPLAAVLGDTRPHSKEKRLEVRRKEFVQYLSLDIGGPHPIVLEGGRLR